MSRTKNNHVICCNTGIAGIIGRLPRDDAFQPSQFWNSVLALDVVIRDQRVRSVEQRRQVVSNSDRYGVSDVTKDGGIGELTSFVLPQHRSFWNGAASCEEKN